MCGGGEARPRVNSAWLENEFITAGILSQKKETSHILLNCALISVCINFEF